MTSRNPRSIFYGWWVVVAAALGLAVSPAPVAFFSVGLLTEPLINEFGWSRSEIVFTITILPCAIILMSPILGSLIDKIGPKRVLVASMILFALGLWALSLVESLTQFYVGYAFIGIVGAGTNSLAYMKILSSWFDKRRGLVLGIASSGIGLGFAIMPMLIQTGLDMMGWQGAYLILGGIILLVGVPCIALIVKNTPEEKGLLPDGDKVAFETKSIAQPITGYTLGEAMKTRQYWLILAIFFPGGGAIYAMAANLVPIINEVETNPDLAIQAASILGIGMMVGRIGAGYLFDKIFAPAITCIVFVAAAIGIGMLALEVNGVWILVAAVLIGLCSGTEGDALGYLVSRYFGLRAYGALYGHGFAAMMVGIGTFPYLMALDFDQTGSYVRTLTIYGALLAIGALGLTFLGPYPSFNKKKSERSEVFNGVEA